MAFLRRGRFIRNLQTATEKFANVENLRRCLSNVRGVDKPAVAVSLNVIGAGPPIELASVLVSTSNNRGYLFNCGEECARFLAQDEHNIANISDIFFTQVKWNCIGGISTLNSLYYKVKNRLFKYHGPKKLFRCIRQILCQSIMKEIEFTPEYCNTNKYFENDTIRIEFVSIEPTMPVTAHMREINEVIVYLCTLKQSFRPGHDRTYFLVVDFPSVDYVNILAKNQRFKEFLKSMENTPFEIVADFTPSYVLNTPEYQELMLSFSSKVSLYLNRNKRYSYLKSVYELQARLGQIDDKIHPQLQLGTTAWNDPKEPDEKIAGTSFHIDENGVMTTESRNVPEFVEQQIPCLNRLRSYPKIVFLGTGGTIATPYRNVSSILVHASHANSILLDCGEGTSAQIHRLYGRQANRVFANIKAIFVSHLHFDHYGGLVELILARRKYLPANRPPIMIMCPKADLKSWLFFYDNTVEAIHDDLLFIDNGKLISRALTPSKCQQLGVRSFNTCRVPHFDEAYAASMVIGDKTPFKITFSGDTTFSDELVALGRNSDLLIHEATFSDQCQNRATATRHSTVADAIEQSRKMNAKYTVLTHFHPKWNAFPVIDTKRHRNVGIAFDNMELVESDLPRLSTMYEQYRRLVGQQFRR